MNPLFTLTAQALIESAKGRSVAEISTACDAAVDFLQRQGCSLSSLRTFRRVLQRELRRRGGMLPAVLATQTGTSGIAGKGITSALERTFGSSIEFSEHADPGLLGGAVLTVGDERLDASIHGALSSLNIHLTAS